MRLSESLICQEVHGNIQFFLYKMRKGNFLSGVKKDKSKVSFEKRFWTHIQAFFPIEPALVYLRWERILPESDSELIEQELTCSVPSIYTFSDENWTPSPHDSVLGGHLRLWSNASSHPTWPQTQHAHLHQVPEGVKADLNRDRGVSS